MQSLYEWIRLMYCYPDRVTDELIDLIASEAKICNYLDIPLQHINQNILKRMNRKIDGFHIRNLLDTIRKRIPDIVLRTSLIVGFPGEGESEYKELVDFVKEGYFQHIGVFAYSREENTPAASFPNQVEEAVKKERRSSVPSKQNIKTSLKKTDRL